MTPARRAAAAAVGLAAVLAPACRQGDQGRAPLPTPPQATVVPRLDTAAVLDTLRAVIARHRMTALPPACYAFVPDPDAPPYAFDVREVHDRACGGDPHTAPRLFSIRWDTAGRVITDVWGQINGVEDTLPGPTYRPPAAP